MKLPDLPETDADKSDSWYYTVDQMVAIRREAFIAGLEEAAKVINPPRFANEADRIIAWDCVNAILALKEQIE